MEVLYPTLCELYAAGKLREFQQVLRPSHPFAGSTSQQNQSSAYNALGTSLSSSFSRSPGSSARQNGHFPTASSYAPASVVNRRDIKGRTALHLAVSDLDAQSQGFLDALLACPSCQINLQDTESGWTPLHKALYLGNLVAARKLMGRPDCDLRLKDREGLTPFDLLNATIDGTNPDSSSSNASSGRKELFTWGSNRNFNLGVNVDGDRPLPEKVKLKPRNGAKWSLFPVSASHITIGRFSTAVLSDEGSNNLRVCGYGTSGRMGTSGVKIALEPLSDFPHKIKQVALGFDHTVLLTTSGDLFTYGLNHHGQLGYAIDSTTAGSKASKTEEPMQLSPRRVLALRKEPVAHIAASRYHTAAYTDSGLLYTWGANRGQLGYASDTLQMQPRIVSAVPAPVVQLAASDYATACLLETGDVFVLTNNTHFKMVFNPSQFPAAMQVYRPPTEVARLQIVKISGGGSDWIAVSKSGDVFQWTLDDSTTNPTQAARSPIRLWDLRSKFTGVVDAAIHGSSIVLCTRSGHVFVGQRRGDAAKGSELRGVSGRKNQWKFTRVPFLQRVVQVATNGSQAYGAIRSDHRLPSIKVPAPSIANDLLSILPHWQKSMVIDPPGAVTPTVRLSLKPDEDTEDARIEQDIADAFRLCRVLEAWDESWSETREGADILFNFSGQRISAHSCVVGSRSPILSEVLTGASNALPFVDGELQFGTSHPFAGLLLVHYLYSDHFPCLWDPRIALRLRAMDPTTPIGLIREELQRLAHVLRLPHLARACGAVERIPIHPSLAHDIQALHHSQVFRGDVEIKLSDGYAFAHSTILRARTPFFSALFHDPIWTQHRRQSSAGQPLPIDLQHIPSTLMSPVLEHIYSDDDNAFFLTKEYETVDARIDFVASVLATANELLLDRLKTVCAESLRPLVDLRTFGAILQEAHLHECRELEKSCLAYAAANAETVLEGGYLTELEFPLLEKLQEYVQRRQIERLPFSRSPVRKDRMYQEHHDYLLELDLAPTPRAQMRRQKVSTSPKLSPSSLSLSPHQPLLFAPSPATTARAQPAKPTISSPRVDATRDTTSTGDDSMFAMDDLDLGPSEESHPTNPPTTTPGLPTAASAASRKGAVWQPRASAASPKPADASAAMPPRSIPSLRQIMSDAENVSPKRPAMPSANRTDIAAVRPPFVSSSEQPWRRSGNSTPQKTESFSSIQSQQGAVASSTSPSTPLRSVSSQSARPSFATPSPQRQQQQQQQHSKSDAASGMGAPVISPTRSVSSPNTSRRPGQDSAWVNYQSATSFFAPSASTSLDQQDINSSFASIQNAQQVEGDALKQKSTKTLGEIQQEEEFERWFAEESKRYQASVEVAASLRAAESGHRGRGGRGGRGGGGRGGGRGGGQTGRGGGHQQQQQNQQGRKGGKKSSDPPKGSQQQPGRQGSPAQRR